MIINTNTQALFAQRAAQDAQGDMSVSMERLSSGKRINGAADDAAGLQIVERFNSQITGLKMAERNANDGISVVQTAEGALDNVTDMLQRMRELAMQSSNGALNDSDRSSLNQEYEQLMEEINRTSNSAMFNNNKLLDGNYQDKTFQIGANSGDSMTLNLMSVDTSSLGVSNQATLTAQGNSNALEIGDLQINNVNIGPALASSDTASTADKTSSAIAKAAAINAVSDQTGVTAAVNTNTATGTTMDGDAGSGAVTINGVDITVTTMADMASTRAAVAAAINQVSGQTGVIAVDTGSNSEGVQLEAADGRNIVVSFGTPTSGVLDAASTGITGGSHYGSYTLSSDSEITVDRGTSSTGAALEHSGLREGTYSPQTAALSSVADAGTAWARGDITINGTLIGETRAIDDSLSSDNKTSSSIAKAAAINAHSETTGVTATVDTNKVDGHSAMDSAGSLAGGILINGVETSAFTTSDDEALTRTTVVAAINAISDRTGVVAVDTGSTTGGVQLMSEDGRNITFSLTDGSGGAAAANFDEEELGLATAGTYEGSFTLSSASAIEIGSVNPSTFGTLNDFENVGVYGSGLEGDALEFTDIDTVKDALSAVLSIDNAIEQVNEQRGEMGAIQNRLEHTIKNLQNMTENMSASRSRIEDADFATESTQLAKSKILQQASTAMLAQANQNSQQVMKLLQ